MAEDGQSFQEPENEARRGMKMTITNRTQCLRCWPSRERNAREHGALLISPCCKVAFCFSPAQAFDFFLLFSTQPPRFLHPQVAHTPIVHHLGSTAPFSQAPADLASGLAKASRSKSDENNKEEP